MIYTQPPADELLAQGDVLDGCPLVRTTPNGDTVRERTRVIVLTQTCDLAQTKAVQVLVAVVHEATAVVAQGALKGPAIRDQVRRGQMFGWYFLPAASDPIPLPESVVNLRDLHTVPRDVLDALAAAGRRVARRGVPYREHLAQHFAVTYMRVALPDPYPTAP